MADLPGLSGAGSGRGMCRFLRLHLNASVLLGVLSLMTVCVIAAEPDYTLRVVVPPGPFHGVHGLAFGPDGALYAGDIMGATVHRVDVATGRHRPAVPPPLGLADDIAFAPAGTPHAGTMVWSGVSVGRLYAQAPGGEARLIADALPGINTVGFSPQGELYVTQTGRLHKALWQIDLSGQTPPRKIWDGGGLNGFVITPDGFLYGPEPQLGRIIRLSLKNLDVEIVAEGFELPTAVEMDPAGLLYVVDFNNGSVTQVNPQTGAKSVLVKLESGLDNMAMAPSGGPYAGKLYISSIGGNAIYELDLPTRALRTVVAGQLTAPGGLTVTGSGSNLRVYIADLFSLRALDPATGQLEYIRPVDATGAYPGSVSHGSLGDRAVLLVASWFTGRVQVIEPGTGLMLREEKGLAAPYGVAMHADGSLLVAEAGANRVVRISTDGARQTLGTGFEFPVGLARVGAHRLYVTDAMAGSVTELDLKTHTQRVVANGLIRPEGIAALPGGLLAVVDSGARAVYRLDPTTGSKTAILADAEIGLLPPEPLARTWIFNDIAAAPDGSLYLTSDVRAGLFRLQPTGRD